MNFFSKEKQLKTEHDQMHINNSFDSICQFLLSPPYPSLNYLIFLKNINIFTNNK